MPVVVVAAVVVVEVVRGVWAEVDLAGAARAMQHVLAMDAVPAPVALGEADGARGATVAAEARGAGQEEPTAAVVGGQSAR